MNHFTLLALILSLSSCSVNYQFRPKGECPTKGVSPLAGNCPTAEEMKQDAGQATEKKQK